MPRDMNSPGGDAGQGGGGNQPPGPPPGPPHGPAGGMTGWAAAGLAAFAAILEGLERFDDGQGGQFVKLSDAVAQEMATTMAEAASIDHPGHPGPPGGWGE